MTDPDLTPRVLETERLRLRPFAYADAPEVRRLAGDRRIADATGVVPHPYEAGMAEEWILGHADSLARDEAAELAVTRRDDGRLVGTIGLGILRAHRRGQLGYWIGVPYWGRGIATEAAAAMLDYAFGPLVLHRVYATHFAWNHGSCRVMEKLGMRLEGVARDQYLKNGRYEDLELHGILEDEWRGRRGR